MTSTTLAVKPDTPMSGAETDVSPRRIAVVVNYDTADHYDTLRRRIVLPDHTTDLYVGGGRQIAGLPESKSLPRDTASWLLRQRRHPEFNCVVVLRHPFITSAEIAEGLQKLKASGQGAYFLIPGLNELLTIGFAALAIYDLGNPAVRLPPEPVAERARRTVAQHLPVPVKQFLKDRLATIGLAQLGLPAPATAPVAPGSIAADGAVRISSSKSVAWVMDCENPERIPCAHSLGDRDLQKRFFVDDVAQHFPMPRVVCLVLSNQCNLKCVMCPYHSPLFIQNRQNDYFDDKKWMPLAIVERLVEEFKHNDQPLTFHMGQLDEPLLHPRIAEIVRLLASVPHSTVHITSNGNLMNGDLARAIIGAGIKSMQFSVDAQTPETYKKIRGAKLEKVQRNVERFLRLRDELRPGLYVNLCIINQEGAAGEIEDFKAYWRAKGASSVSVYQLFKPEEGNSAHWVVPNKYFEEKTRTPCTALWDQCFVYPDGEVSLCCTTLSRVPQDGVISKGNFNEQSLKDIWFGALYQKVRDDLINERFDDHKYCKECDNWSSSYQYKKTLADGTEFIYGESMGYYYFPAEKPKPDLADDAANKTDGA
jgi:MoaA/NifB/PqqE/SkfB family radical SAM enzyme